MRTVDTSCDLELMVGEMEAPPCESLDHTTAKHVHGDGPATHYARVQCPSCDFNAVKSYCAEFARAVSGPVLVICTCGATHKSADIITILGSVLS